MGWFERWRELSDEMIRIHGGPEDDDGCEDEHGEPFPDPSQRHKRPKGGIRWKRTFLAHCSYDNLKSCVYGIIKISDLFFSEPDNLRNNFYFIPRAMFCQDKCERLFGCLRQRALGGTCDYQSVLLALADHRSRLNGVGMSFSDRLNTAQSAGSNNYTGKDAKQAQRVLFAASQAEPHAPQLHMQHSCRRIAPTPSK